MKRTISISTIFIFLMSIYFIPSLSAITFGEIKPDKQDGVSVNKNDDSGVLNKENLENKKEEKKIDQKEEINPRLVCLLSVIMPGGGQFYLNNDVKGIGFCLAAGVGYTATGYFMVKTMLADTGSIAFKNYLLLTGFLFFITIIIHFVGIVEAYSDADEISKQKLFGNENNNPYITNFVSY